MKNQIVIAYKDPSGNNKYQTLNGITTNELTTFESTIEDWKRKNPGCEIKHIFNTAHDLVGNNTYVSRQEFAENCEKYQLKETHLGAKLKDGRIITGIHSKNRKYPIILFDPKTEKNIKASPEYVRHNLED